MAQDLNHRHTNGDGMAPGADCVTVAVPDPVGDRRWDQVVAGHPSASVHHLAVWQTILGGAYRCRPAHVALEDADGRLRGVLPLLLRARAISGRRITSPLLATDAGPLAESPAAETMLLAAACRAADEAGASLRVVSHSAAYDGDVPVVEASPAWVLAIPDDLDDLRRRWRKGRGNIGRYLRQAEAAGLTVRETSRPADLRAFHAIYLRTARKHHAVPHSLRLLEAMRRGLPPGVFQLLLIERDGRAVAGALNLVWRDGLEALFSGVDERCLDARPSHALHWETIRLAHARNLRRINFGRARHGGTQAAFKAQWGAEPTSTFELVHPLPAGAAPATRPASPLWGDRLADVVWTRAPLRAMSAASALMYRYL